MHVPDEFCRIYPVNSYTRERMLKRLQQVGEEGVGWNDMGRRAGHHEWLSIVVLKPKTALPLLGVPFAADSFESGGADFLTRVHNSLGPYQQDSRSPIALDRHFVWNSFWQLCEIDSL